MDATSMEYKGWTIRAYEMTDGNRVIASKDVGGGFTMFSEKESVEELVESIKQFIDTL